MLNTLMRRAFKYRIYPTPEQERILSGWQGQLRFIWNQFLAKAISAQGWDQFVTFLGYKLQWNGGELIKIDRFAPSSQLCSRCGYQQKMSLSERTYNCPSCGLSIDRDYNAALNIKAFGLDVLRRAGTVRTKQICDLLDACGDTSNGESGCSDSSCVSGKQEKFLRADGEYTQLSQESTNSYSVVVHKNL